MAASPCSAPAPPVLRLSQARCAIGGSPGADCAPMDRSAPTVGYFDDVGNRRVLSEYRRVLRPGGRLLIEMHNRDHFVRHFAPAPYSHSVHIGDDLMMDTSTFDCVEGRIETDRLVVRDGQVRRCHHSVRLPAITEMREWILAAGFSGVGFRARDGQEPAIDRPRLVVLATA